MDRSIFERISGFVIFGGVVAAGAGYYLNLPFLLAGGVALLGGGVIVSGLGAILQGEWKSVRRRRVRASYSGIQARIIGAYMVLLGVLVVGVSLLLLRGETLATSELLRDLTQRAEGIAILCLVIGGAGSMWGLVNLLGSDEQNRSAGGFALSLPMRLIGVLMLLGGLAVFAFGLARFFAPAMADAWYQQILRLVGVAA